LPIRRRLHPNGQEPAGAVEVCRGAQVKLDPVTEGRIVPDGGVVIDVYRACDHPAPCNPKIDHTGRFQVGKFPGFQ
jgi:hypothetical protein